MLAADKRACINCLCTYWDGLVSQTSARVEHCSSLVIDWSVHSHPQRMHVKECNKKTYSQGVGDKTCVVPCVAWEGLAGHSWYNENQIWNVAPIHWIHLTPSKHFTRLPTPGGSSTLDKCVSLNLVSNASSYAHKNSIAEGVLLLCKSNKVEVGVRSAQETKS